MHYEQNLPSIKGGRVMDCTLTRKMLVFLVISFLIIGFSFNTYAGGSISIKWGKDSEPEATLVATKHKKKGPPAHAPAHGYRAKHQYRYYPGQSVYYDTGRRLYFYLKGDSWEVGASLPSSFRGGLGDSVRMELDTDEPYKQHREHIKKYPPKNFPNT
jgi:hypothetical protein